MKFLPRCQLSMEITPTAVPGAGLSEGRNNLVIPPQFTIEFDIRRQNLGSSQEATFRIRQLGEKTRNLIYKDPYARSQYLAIQFRAGYGNDPVLPLCFNGWIRSALSYREKEEFITEISAWDGGLAMANGFISQTVVGGQSIQFLLKTLVGTLPRMSGIPLIGSFPGSSSRGTVLFGPTWNIVQELSGRLACIDNGQVKILNYSDYVSGNIPVINAASGLLGSPRRGEATLEFDMLFEPRFTIGQLVKVQSSTNRLFDGVYKVLGFHHRGIISPSVDGERRTSVSLFFGEPDWQLVSGSVVQ